MKSPWVFEALESEVGRHPAREPNLPKVAYRLPKLHAMHLETPLMRGHFDLVIPNLARGEYQEMF